MDNVLAERQFQRENYPKNNFAKEKKFDRIKNSLKVFFGAADMVLDREDVRYPMEADAEIVGTGATTGILPISTSRLRIRIKSPSMSQSRLRKKQSL